MQHWASASKAYGGLSLTPHENVLGGMLCQWECTPSEERERVINLLSETADRTWNDSEFYNEEEFYINFGKIKELSEKYGKTVVLKTSVDPSIIGGMVLYVGNEMLDASVKAKFEGLKKQLKTIQIS